MADTFDPKFGAFVSIPFVKSNVDTASTNLDFTHGSGVNSLAVMPYAGSVVSLSVKGNANVTAGTVAFSVHKEGTEYTAVSSILATMTTAAGASNIAYGTVRQGVMTFAAGEGIGVSVSSATNLAATTIDFDALLIVCFNPS
jgi:hypothetical protein